jgi:hypothetical protein
VLVVETARLERRGVNDTYIEDYEKYNDKKILIVSFRWPRVYCRVLQYTMLERLDGNKHSAYWPH